MKKLSTILLLLLCPAAALPQQGAVKAGYAVVTPLSPGGKFVVTETFGLKLDLDSMQAGTVASDLTTSAVLFVNASERLARNSGIAFMNPWNSDARITMTIRRDDGIVLGSKTIFVPGRSQTSQLITQLFSDQRQLPKEFAGIMTVKSNLAVGIVALRFRGAIFSTEPITHLDQVVSLPALVPGVGGSGAVLFPQFAVGGGWATEFVIANLDTTILRFRVDVFAQDGSPMAVSLNGKTSNTFFDLLVFPGGVLTLTPRDANGDSQF
jgi:hypothetical protein